MILDFKHRASYPSGIIGSYFGCKCFVNGQEVKQVWFIDTEAGLVRTYDVLGDGKVHSCYESMSPNDAEVLNEVWTKDLYGEVTVELPT
jgi:hypothetical protein